MRYKGFGKDETWLRGSLIRPPRSCSGLTSDVTLGEKAKVKETVQLYSRVWQLPSYRVIVLRMVFLVVAGSALLSISKNLLISTFSFYLFILGIPVFIGSGLLYIIATDENSPLDGRRTAGLVHFGLVFWIVLSVIGGLIDALIVSSAYEVRFSILGVVIAYMAFAFLVNGLSDHHIARNVLASLMPPSLWILTMLFLAPLSGVIPSLPSLWYIPIIGSFVIATIAVRFIYRAVSVPFERDLGINGPALLRAFGHDYLADNPEPIEKILTRIATVQDVPVEILLFKDEQGPVACGVIEYVHPGPFRDIGSSGLPATIIEHIKEKHKIPAFVMHGSCTHQQNLTTKEDYPIVLTEIDRLISETQVFDEASGPHWSDEGKYKVWTLFVDNDVLTITTSAPEFTDDVSLDVGYDAANMIRSHLPQVKRVAVVDAHNCIDDSAISINQGDPEAAEYVGSISEAVFSTINEPKTRLQLGLHQVNPDDISQKEGIGPGGVIAVVLKQDQNEMALISIDGNNMEPGFREEALSLLKSQG
ncbi:MAG: DUF2070 family protein, partial [Promethearchaeota archaeon]